MKPSFLRIFQEVNTEDGRGIIVCINTPYNGLYADFDRAMATVWYGTDKSVYNNFMQNNEIKYSSLIPKSEVIEVTNDMIQGLRKSSKVSLLTQYSDNIKLEQIPTFLKKLVDISIDSYGNISFGESKLYK